MGDPSGIGPEVIFKALAELSAEELSTLLIIGDLEFLRAAGARWARPATAAPAVSPRALRREMREEGACSFMGRSIGGGWFRARV